MDGHIKEGQLYMQHHKIVKKWKRSWAVLFADGPQGVARLEVFDGERPGSGDWKSERKVIRLSECVTVLATPTEPGPHEDMASFCIRTVDHAYVFATDAQDCSRWVEALCQIAFQGSRGTDSQQLKMEENLIYESREEGQRFWVTMQLTDASERCGLHGAYWLSVDDHSLILSEGHTQKILLAWPYRLLRRYGHDKGMFSMEAGRRCESGPGAFTFNTTQGGQIFACVETAIRDQRVLAEEGPGSCSAPCERGGRSPMPLGGAALLDDPGNVYSLPLDCVREPADSAEPVYAAPLDLIEAPPTSPPHPHPPSPRPHYGNAPDPQYSELNEGTVCSRPERQGAMRGRSRAEEGQMVTSDPSDPHDLDDPSSLYSQVSKHASPNITWDPDSDDIIYDNLGVI
ncbi:hypothetical protein SKAU_G00319880 [Synaphobranchus kaupii]|uniref:Docking protein 1 n=1 Tax=Synaphobranchus kaupii TaxID=118154 RepID=A0A9Q1IIR3_SYNKA|nr:hypothetical protein SKAU_G00319880 [Synaphobranchus kaupii]